MTVELLRMASKQKLWLGMPKNPSRPGTYLQFLRITCFIRRITLVIEIVIFYLFTLPPWCLETGQTGDYVDPQQDARLNH